MGRNYSITESAFSKALIVAALFVVLMAQSASAKKIKFDSLYQWEPVTDEDWNLREDSALGIKDAAIIFERIESDETDYIKDKCYYTFYQRIRILSKDGRDWANVSIPVFHKKQKIKLIAARTILPDGKIIPMPASQVSEKEVVKSKKTKLKQQSFSIPGVTDDCIIEFVYKIQLTNVTNLWTIQKGIWLKRGELVWKFYRGKGMTDAQFEYAAKSFAPNYLSLYMPHDITIERFPSLKDTHELRFTIDSIPLLENEPYSLPESARKTQLRCYYASPGSARLYWSEEADDMSGWVDNFAKKDKKLKDILKSLKEIPTEEERIKEAYDWVQRTFQNSSFIDVLDDNGQKKKKLKKIKSVDDAIKRGYANMYQLNLLFCDLLRELDIDARIAWAADRDERLFVFDAKYWQFDRSLVALPDGDSYRFLSPGELHLEYGQSMWYSEGIQALVGGSTDDMFYTVPFSEAKDNALNRLIQLTLDEDLSLAGVIGERRNGHQAIYFRRWNSRNTKEVSLEKLEEEFDDMFSGSEVDSITLKNASDQVKQLVVNANLRFDAPLEQLGDRIFLKPFNYMSATRNPFTRDERDQSIVFSYAYQTNETVMFEFPEGWKAKALPSDTTFSNTVGYCMVSFKNLGASLSVQRRFELAVPFWPVESYADVKSLFETRESFNELTVILEQTTIDEAEDTEVSDAEEIAD